MALATTAVVVRVVLAVFCLIVAMTAAVVVLLGVRPEFEVLRFVQEPLLF